MLKFQHLFMPNFWHAACDILVILNKNNEDTGVKVISRCQEPWKSPANPWPNGGRTMPFSVMKALTNLWPVTSKAGL